jgi:hypothetical protein
MENKQPVRVGGLLPDNELAVAKVPLFTSEWFIKTKPQESEIIARGKQDKQAPRVVFITPLSQSVVSGIVTIQASVTDNVGVVFSSLLIDGVMVNEFTNPPSQSFSIGREWEFSKEGYHTITAIAKDAAGNTKTVTITVTVKGAVVEPPVTGGIQITMPPVLNQGSEGSCAAFAIGYAARSVEYFNATGLLKTFSPEHLYNNVKFGSDCYSGTAMQTCLEFIMANGILPWSEMPYSSSNGCTPYETEAQKAIALDYKIAGFFKMYVTDTAAIKGMVRLNKPVIINILTSYAFNWAVYDFTWNEPGSAFVTPHCVVICGYDDSRNAYRIFNSWGDKWAGGGYAWMDYDFFLTRTGTWCYAIK